MAAALLALAACVARAQPASPVAGSVVSSREWHVKRSSGSKEEEFIGDVHYRSGPSIIRSDWALYEHQPQTWRLRGHVNVEHRLEAGDVARASADSAFYSVIERSGSLEASEFVQFSRQPSDGSQPDQGRAKRLRWEGRERVLLDGEVHSWGPRLESWSDRATCEAATGECALEGGRPVLATQPGLDERDDWSGALKADAARAWRGQRRLSADGRVVGWIEFKRHAGRQR